MSSPFNLVFEDAIVQGGEEPGWRVLVAAILRVRSRSDKVRATMADLFERWPNAEALSKASENDVAYVCRGLWFQNMRAQRLIHLSLDWVAGLHLDSPRGVSNLSGVGTYGCDAYALFVEKRTENLFPEDGELQDYLGWRLSC